MESICNWSWGPLSWRSNGHWNTYGGVTMGSCRVITPTKLRPFSPRCFFSRWIRRCLLIKKRYLPMWWFTSHISRKGSNIINFEMNPRVICAIQHFFRSYVGALFSKLAGELIGIRNLTTNDSISASCSHIRRVCYLAMVLNSTPVANCSLAGQYTPITSQYGNLHVIFSR